MDSKKTQGNNTQPTTQQAEELAEKDLAQASGGLGTTLENVQITSYQLGVLEKPDAKDTKG